MLRLIFDTNCIIDLEEERADAVHLQQILNYWKEGNIELAVVAVSASENQPGGEINQSYDAFERKLEASGLRGGTELLPIAIWDVAYYDHALWSSDILDQLASDLRDVLFPDFLLNPAPENEREKRFWRNKLCDVLVVWCCVFHKWEVLVTRDKNFHKNKKALSEFGIKHVLYPVEAIMLIQS